MADKLLPCPFCGGEATLVEDIYNDQLYNYVICSNDDCNANTGRCDTEDEAITKWNNRPSPWHTGEPTEEGWYLFSYKYLDTIRYGTDCFLDGKWVFNPALDEKMLAWQKIEPFKED